MSLASFAATNFDCKAPLASCVQVFRNNDYIVLYFMEKNKTQYLHVVEFFHEILCFIFARKKRNSTLIIYSYDLGCDDADMRCMYMDTLYS